MATAGRVYTHEASILYTALDVERVPGLVQSSTTAPQHHSTARNLSQSSLDLVGIVGSGIRRGDTSLCQSLVRIKSLYQCESALSHHQQLCIYSRLL
jgi:hypothetical protein